MASEKQALVELNAITDKAQVADSTKNFLLYLVRFVQKFDGNPELQPVIEAIQQQDQADQKQALELREKALAIINDIHKQYHDYCSSKGVIIEAPCPFEAYDNPDPQKRIYTTRNVVIEKYESLENLLLGLAKISSDHYDFISRFTAITSPINMYHQQVSIFLKIPAYNEWLDAQKDFEDKLLTTIGHHWNCIVCIYLAITDRDKILKPGNQSNFFEQWWVSSLRGRAINTINDQEDPCSQKFDLPALKYSLDYVLDFSKEVLAKSEEPAVTTNQTNTDDLIHDQTGGKPSIITAHDLRQDEVETPCSSAAKITLESYDNSKGTLLIGQHEILFPKKNGGPRTVLPFLTKDPQKNWSWDEMYEATQEKEPSLGRTRRKKYKASLYHNYEHINQQVSKQSGGKITAFLIFSTDSVHINQKYLQ